MRPDCYQCEHYTVKEVSSTFYRVICERSERSFPVPCKRYKPEPGVDDKEVERHHLSVIQKDHKLLEKINGD